MCARYSSGFPGGSDCEESACSVGDLGSIPGSGQSPGGGHGNPLQYYCLHGKSPWTEEPGSLQSTGSQSQTQWATKHNPLLFGFPYIGTGFQGGVCLWVSVLVNCASLYGQSLQFCCCCCLVAKSCRCFCNLRDCSPPGSSVHGISQKRILEWASISFSRGSSWPRDCTRVSCLAGELLTAEPPWTPPPILRAAFYLVTSFLWRI